MRRLLLVTSLVLVMATLACAKTYTNRDVDAMKRVYERTRRSTQTVSDARFPSELLKEPWKDPVIVPRFLPFQDWENEYRGYFARHTGDGRLDLSPRILVMHYTVCDYQTAWNSFTNGVNMDAGDHGNVFGHPSVHFMIDRDGTITQLFPLDRRCTGAYGVNHVALQVELVASNEADLVNNRPLMASSFRLARQLVSRFRIPLQKVYGHYDVSDGKSVVGEYLDQADSKFPTSYPPSCARTDPGRTYMAWLRSYLAATSGGR